jgi:hypothetical protein
MGGNALSPGLTQRKPLHEYLEIKKQVLSLLASAPATHILQIDTVTEVPGKEEFGDLDLIYSRCPGVTETDLQTFIQNLFHPTEIFQCGNVTSFDFLFFQIDFIECPEPNLPLTKFCLSYGDRGMILGQIARWHGFSLGFHGLMITSEDLEWLCEAKGVTEKVILTIDPQEIKSYFGLPLSDDTIVTREDIGLYCRSSPWYRPEIFTGKLNAEGRKRWAKRRDYRHFIEQICVETAAHYRLLLSSRHDTVSSAGEGSAEKSSLDLKSHLFHFMDRSLCSELSDMTAQLPLPSLLSGDPHFFCQTPPLVRITQRRERIRAAITHFEKWEEVEELRRRYQEQRERREKLNYSQLLALGIAAEDVARARLEFLRWLLRLRDSASTAEDRTKEGEDETEVTEGNRMSVEERLLKNETVESIQEKLREWHHTAQETKTVTEEEERRG